MNTYSAIIVSGLPQNGLVIVDSSFTNAAAFIALALGSGRVVAGSETTTYTIKHMCFLGEQKPVRVAPLKATYRIWE